jgi:hypothetical protein
MGKNTKMDPRLKKALENQEEFYSDGLTINADPNAQDQMSRRQLLDFMSRAGAATVVRLR